jgi:flavodoxin
MRALVIYESMYGNTHHVADAIGKGIERAGQVRVVPVGEATADALVSADLIVVGGPTHAHGMTREATRESAVADARKPGSDLTLDPDAEGEGLRDWFDALPAMAGAAAAFDTRIDMPPALTGRASKGISKRLRRHGLTEIVEPESFFVSKDSVLGPEEETRAREWGEKVAAAMAEHLAAQQQ